MNNLIVLDFETYFNKEITLKKLNYSEYIPQATPFIIATIRNNKLTCTDEIAKHLDLIDWNNTTVVGHNLLFDALVLKHWYNIEANQYIDTLSLARLHYPSIKHDLGSLAEHFCPTIPKLKENLDAVKGKHWDELTNQEKESLKTYCCNDVLITAKLYEHFINNTPQIELDIINHTIKTWINPTLILDTNKLTNVIIQEQEEINKKLKEINLTKENIRSDKKFYDYLKSKNYEPPLKFSTKQQKLIPAFSKTDSIFQEFYHNNPELQELLDLKRTINSNILESRTLKLLQASKYNNNRIPIGYNYCGAFTGRFSGANKLNMQNLPKKSPLRDAIMAPKGYKLIVCDLAQIEARVLAWLAGETKILEAFKNNRDLYSEVASKIFNRPINKHDNPDERFIGKCLGANTKVLTNQGWKSIIHVSATDLLWDGVSWVQHKGLSFQGNQPTLTSHGITATPSHLILTAEGWQKWEDALTNPSLFQSALKLVNLPSLTGNPTIEQQEDQADGNPLFVVPVVGKEQSIEKILNTVVQHVVITAQKLRQALNVGGATKPQWTTTNTELAYSIAYLPALDVATQKPINNTLVTEDEEYTYTQNGAKTAVNFYSTYKPWKVGITQIWNWIESMLTDITNLITFDSSPENKTSLTDDQLTNNHNTLLNSNKNVPVYDLLSAGPNNRFTIWSNKGPIIVHNSAVLGLGYGMSAPKFETFCALQGRKLDPTFCYNVVNTYRTEYCKIPELWHLLQEHIHILQQQQTTRINDKLLIVNDQIILPSSRRLRYEGVEYTDMWRLRNNKRIYGALIVENIVQAISRDILVEQLLTIHPIYPVVMHTHDELIVCVPEQTAQTALDFVLTTMKTPPLWADDLPLNAEANMGDRYGDCK